MADLAGGDREQHLHPPQRAPEATPRIAGSIARAPFIAGEPIREPKLVKADGSGFMAAILPTGMRAISTEISPETGAGGFILPNDRVDVILSKREKNPDAPAPRYRQLRSHPDQRPRARDRPGAEGKGRPERRVGKTVTLELKPEQAETLARARQSGTLALALRSIADVNAVEKETDDRGPRRGEGVNIVRYGIPKPDELQK
jgi:pilus assembly protein CpaB